MPLAKSLATIDFLSTAALSSESASAAATREFDAVEIPFARRGTRAVEHIDLMKRLWRENHVERRGTFFKTTDLSVGPHTTQPPHPPIWMGGAADTGLKRVGALADGYICGTGSLKRFESVWKKLLLAAAANGRDPASIHKAGITYLTMDEPNSRAKATCEEYLKAYYGNINLDVDVETILGSPNACAERLAALLARGFETVILRLVIPDLVQLDLLAEKILPLLRIS